MLEPVLNEFCFKGFSPDDTLAMEAQNTLDGLLDLAPYDSTSRAVLERDGTMYRCRIEMFSAEGPFSAEAAHVSPRGAVQFVKEFLLKKLSAWRETRFASVPTELLGRHTKAKNRVMWADLSSH